MSDGCGQQEGEFSGVGRRPDKSGVLAKTGDITQTSSTKLRECWIVRLE